MDVTQTMLEANAWQAVLRVLLSALIGLCAYFLVRPREVKSSLHSARRWATFALYGCAGFATIWRWEATLFFVLLLPSLAAIGGVLWGRFRRGLPWGFEVPLVQRGQHLWRGAPTRARAAAGMAVVVVLAVAAYWGSSVKPSQQLPAWQQWQNYDRCVIEEGQKVNAALLGYVQRDCFRKHAASISGWQLSTAVAAVSFEVYFREKVKEPLSGPLATIAEGYWRDHLRSSVHPDGEGYYQRTFLQWVASNEAYFAGVRRQVEGGQ